MDERDQVIAPVAVVACDLDQFFGLGDQSALVWGPGNADRAAATQLEQAFVSEQAECAKNGVLVDAEDGGEVTRLRDSLAPAGLSFLDRSPDCGCDLFVQRGGVAAIYRGHHDLMVLAVDFGQETINTSFNGCGADRLARGCRVVV